MSIRTHYVVQLSPSEFAGSDGPAKHIDEAARLSLTDARRLFRLAAYETRVENAPRRFPRVIKVTIETKTIITRR